jgi:hypothetical protein
MYPQRLGAQAEFRQEEAQRVKDSPSLASKFQQLKSLTVVLKHYTPEAVTKTSETKYQVNLANAKSVFRFNCPNGECIRGGFDLSEDLAKVVTARRKTASGEVVCEGWRSKTTINTVHCNNILRYELSLAY